MAAVVTFLGTGDAFSSSGRHQAGYLLNSSTGAVLLDCGSSTLTAMKRDGIEPGCVDAVLLSHLHGDHFAGIPYLFLEYLFEAPRTRPLVIAGPPGTEERVGALFRATYRDLAQKPLPFPLAFTEMLPASVHELGAFRVEPFRVPHQEHDVSLGMRVTTEAGRCVVYSGDTGWTDDLVARSQGADLFICECCFFETRVPYHLDYPRLDENRRRFGAKRLILSHLGREVLARRAEISIELAADGLAVEL